MNRTQNDIPIRNLGRLFTPKLLICCLLQICQLKFLTKKSSGRISIRSLVEILVDSNSEILSGNSVGVVARSMFPALGIDSTRYDRAQFTLLWTELDDMIGEYLSKQLNEVQDRFLEEMPSVEDTIANVRYHIQNRLTSNVVRNAGHMDDFSALETKFLEDMSQDYAFLVDLMIGECV